MPDEIYNSSLLKIIQSWLDTMTADYIAASTAESESALEESLALMGYGAPYDREQRCLNNFLKYKRANKLACLTIWAYYYDYKIASAAQISRPLYN